MLTTPPGSSPGWLAGALLADADDDTTWFFFWFGQGELLRACSSLLERMSR